MRLICSDRARQGTIEGERERERGDSRLLPEFQFHFGTAKMSERRLIQISHVFGNIKQQTME